VGGVAVSPAIGSSDTPYTVRLTYTGSGSISVIGMAAEATWSTVTYKLSGDTVNGTYGNANTLTLNEGSSTKVYVRVTAANGAYKTYTVTVYRTKQIGIVVNLPGTEAVNLGISGTKYTISDDIPQIKWENEGSLTFTVSGDYDANSLQWFVDGVAKTGSGNSLTIQARSLGPKIYNLTVKVKKSGAQYSVVKQFNVVIQ
jgi:hypothetical protein